MFRRIGRVFKPFVDIKNWIGWNQLKDSSKNFGSLAKEVFTLKKPSQPKENFQQAVVRLNLSEEMLVARKKTFFRTAIFYSVIAVGIFIYAVNLLFSGVILGAFIAAVLVVMMLALMFREHFWYTQMKHRRLGISVAEWVAYTFGGVHK